MTTIHERIARFLFGNVIDDAVRAATAAISVRVDDSPGWDSLTQRGPADRPWSERQKDLTDTLDAWRKSFLIHRIVTLTRSYVVGSGIEIGSEIPEIDQFIRKFWDHRQNHLNTRLGPMCDELTRSGELFPTLHTNKADGMSYVRFVPASHIREIKTAENDYEIELEYGELQTTTAELKWWIGPGHPRALKTHYNKFEPLMLHWSVNQVIGATRGEGDLGPILPWARRYSEWLRDRVRLNRQRTRQGLLDIKIADDGMVKDKRDQLRKTSPIEAGIYVHGPGEEVTMHSLNIRADDAEPDGKVLRLAIATGANAALHYMGEGESVNYATAKEMGEPTTLFYSERQRQLTGFLCDLVTTAYTRYAIINKLSLPNGTSNSLSPLQLTVATSEVARADNLALAQAASQIVTAFATMANLGWIDDQTAIRLSFKFAGEVISEEEIAEIIDRRGDVPSPTSPNTNDEN